MDSHRRSKVEQVKGLPLKKFGFRLLQRDPEDVLLSQLMAADLAEGRVNLSTVIKRLLLDWYRQRLANGGLDGPLVDFTALQKPVAGVQITDPVAELAEDPDDPLVRNMVGIDFNDL